MDEYEISFRRYTDQNNKHVAQMINVDCAMKVFTHITSFNGISMTDTRE